MERKNYIYPQFVPNKQIMKGLYILEWAFVAVPVILGLIAFGLIGFVIGATLSILLFGLFVRLEDARSNLLSEISRSLYYFLGQQKFKKAPRTEEKEEEEEVVPDDSGTSKKEKKKNRKKYKKEQKKVKKVPKAQKAKKEKVMQDLFPFHLIEDSMVEMENGDVFIFLKIRSNNLDLLSFEEIDRLIKSYSKDIDRDKLNIGYFIQDSVFNISNNIQAIAKAKETQKIAFLRMLLDQMKYTLVDKKNDASKKSYYLKIHLKASVRKNVDLDEVKRRAKEIYKKSLNPTECSKTEIKQMLAIFGNRIFADDFPDSELEIELEESNRKSLLFKHKKTYKDLQLPGIYDFKDMIVPITANFLPSNAKIGRNITKTYAIASYNGTKTETNLLAKISNIPGVATSIYLDKLSIKTYKSNMRQDIRSKKSEIKDDVDMLDFEDSKENLTGAYKKTLKDKQNMYYVSVYFLLSAKTQIEFDTLEELFLSAVDDVSITLDDLKTMQKGSYLSVSPIGQNVLGKYVKQNIPSESVANLYPFNNPSLMDPKGLYIGNIVDKKNPFLFDPFTYRGTNNNILILGMSGVGKTVLMMLLLQNAACMGAYIRNIDFEGTQVEFIKKIGGINIDIAGGGDFTINPLQVRIPDEIRTGILDDYIGEVKSFMRVYKQNWNDNLLDLFEEFLRRAYHTKNITNDTDFTKLSNTDYPILTDVYNEVENERDHHNEKISLATKDELRKLLLGLKSAVEGADSALFNRHTYLGAQFHDEGFRQDAFNNVKIINFDFSRMMNTDKSRKLAQWTNIFTYITQFVNNNMNVREDILVSIDELHEILKKEYMPIINIISSYERRFRKYNSSFLKATQTMDEVDSNDDEMESKVKPLFSQSATKFLFHLGDIDYDKPRKLMNLTKNEIEKLQENRSHQCLVRVNKALYDLDVMMPAWFSEVKSDA